MFKGNRGMVLRSAAAVVAMIGAKGDQKFSVPKGTRLKFMSDIGDGKIRAKIKDPSLPKNVQGTHVEIAAKNVTRVERGRPEAGGSSNAGSSRTAAKKGGKKTAAKKAGGRKTAAKKASGEGRKRAAKTTEAPAAGSDDLDLSVLDSAE